MKQKFEHKIVKSGFSCASCNLVKELETDLKIHEDEGWELVSTMVDHYSQIFMFFKRAVETP